MRRFVSGFLAAVTAASILVTSAYADVSDQLVISDRVTTDLYNLQKRKAEIDAKRLAQRSAANAQQTYSACSGQELLYYLNRKTLTKREYEAFKWSFIFSQFANPLEDSLLDVLNQPFFRSLAEDKFNIESVMNSIRGGSIGESESVAGNSFIDDLNFMMLQNVDFEELVNDIRDNYKLYTLRDPIGHAVDEESLGGFTLAQALQGEIPLYAPMYIYDTEVQPASSTDIDYLNALYYNQDRIEGNKYQSSSSTSNATVKNINVPVAFYDASFALYMQLAVSAFLKHTQDNSIKSVDDIILQYGNQSLLIDSYGNICISTGAILIPNSGNTALVNKLVDKDSDDGTGELLKNLIKDENSDMSKYLSAFGLTDASEGVLDQADSEDAVILSRINLYNNWLISQYSDITRSSATIYPDTYNIMLANGNPHRHDLRVETDGLANTYILTEPSTVDPGDEYLWHFRYATATETTEAEKLLFGQQNIWYSKYTHVIDSLGEIKAVGNWDIGGVRGAHSTFLDFYLGSSSTTQMHGSMWFHNVFRDATTVTNWGNLTAENLGIDKTEATAATWSGLLSAYNLRAGAYAPFTAPTSNTENPLAEYFVNKYPIIKSKVNIAPGGDQGHGSIPGQYAHIDKQLEQRWKFTHVSEQEGPDSGADTSVLLIGKKHTTSALNQAVSDTSSMLAYNNCVSLLMQLDNDHIIHDYRFVGESTHNADGTDLAALWLPKDAIDVGQGMSAFAYSTEKGMFLAEYNQIYDGCTLQFQESLRNYLDDVTEIVKKGNAWNIVGENTIGFKLALDASGSNKNWTVRPSTVNMLYTVNTSDINSIADMWRDYAGLVANRDSSVESASAAFCDFVDDTYNGAGPVSDDTWKDIFKALEKNDEKLNACARATILFIFEYIKSQVIVPNSTSDVAATMKIESAAWNGFKVTATPSSLRTAVEEACVWFGIDPDQFLNIIYVGLAENNNNFDLGTLIENLALNKETQHEGSSTIYDEYTYRLRSLQGVENHIDCKNADSFANIIYYWDRYYLVNSAFNQKLTKHVSDQFEQIHQASDQYDAYCEQRNLSSVEYPFSQYIKDFSSVGALQTNTSVKQAFINEYALQARSYSDWLKNDEHGVSLAAMPKVSGYLKFYEYLHEDTIIVHPFGWQDDATRITLYGGIGDKLISYAESFNDDGTDYTDMYECLSAKQGQTINPIQTIMALQKNTDYTRNNAIAKPETAPQVQRASKEDLMDSAMEFFEHPITSLSYIFAGFLYKVHSSIATGNISSVFSLNFLLESNIYKWIMSRYVAIMTIAVVVLLLLKLFQFALSKSKNFAGVGRSVLGILAVCLVPVIVFNSFVWAFNASSHWALSGTTDKLLLAQIDRYSTHANSDANVTAEINAFKEQFNGLEGEWSTMQVQEIDNYSPVGGPVYSIKPINSYIDRTQFSSSVSSWYDASSFVPVHKDLYDESYFYYFYDYIKSEYYKYCVDNNVYEVANFISNYASLDPINPDDVKIIQDTENVLSTLQGHFISMLNDTNFVYGNSLNELSSSRYDGVQVKDLAGMYNIFSTSNYGFVNTLQSSKQFLAMRDSKLMNASDNVSAKLWINQSVIDEYVQEKIRRGEGLRESVNGEYPIFTSVHDAFNQSLNGAASFINMNDSHAQIILTPLEKELCNVSKDIYDSTVAALTYMPEQIHDEAAITLMAFIATFKFNEAFGLEPVAPLEESIYLDAVVRTAFVNDLSLVASNTNTLYAMVEQGDSIGRIALVVLLELIITVASVLRVAMILYITVASFVILALRLLHKTPATVDLFYGIAGHVIILLILHMLTLFLVVIAVQWVANATSAIPGIFMDIMMIVFSIVVSRLLVALVKNLFKDAVNIGGVKIRAGLYKLAGAIVNLTGKVKASVTGELTSSNMNATINHMSPVLTGVEADSYAQQARLMQSLHIIREMQEAGRIDYEHLNLYGDTIDNEHNPNAEGQHPQRTLVNLADVPVEDTSDDESSRHDG